MVLAALVTANPVVGQITIPPSTPQSRSAGAVPSVLPIASEDPVAPPPRPAEPNLDFVNPVPPGAPPADPVGTLTGMGPNGLPPGAYASPWYTDGPGCCGPLGKHGLVAYELYVRTGASIPFGSGPFTDHIFTGVGVGGGGRSLFFNPAGDAAWVFDLGLSYTYNRGSANNFLDLFNRQQPLQNQTTRQVIPQPDRFVPTRIRGLHRTSFNFAIGRDWFIHGPGLPGGEPGWNLRWGMDVGGRWGTAHVDLVPLDEPGGYTRRQKVFRGVFVGLHTNYEVPFGGWIWCIGGRGEWGYDWMDIVPPIKGDVQSINLFLETGWRF
jgi:hypothetical protein